MAHTELNLRERRVIEDMLNAKIPIREIAAQIGRHVSTIYRDIKRNRYADNDLPELNGYYGVVAQRAAVQRRARRRKLVRLVGLRKAVIKQLKEGWSPEQIAGRLLFEGRRVRVSHETIYAVCLQSRRPIQRAGPIPPKPAQETETAPFAQAPWPCFPARSVHP